MFTHHKDLQFEVRVDQPDPRFATLLQEQFGGANGELKAAMQYFTQAFVLREKNPKMYDLFMDIATEELSHLEMVGAMITMLLDGFNDDLKQANERCDWMATVASPDGRDQAIHQVAMNPLYCVLTGGGPDNSTTMIGLLIYKNAFEYSKYGLACAQAILLAIVIAIISLVQFKMMGVDVEY